MLEKLEKLKEEVLTNIDNIANEFSWVKADKKNRIILILVDEELGY